MDRPRPPHPGLTRRPTGSFGWLDDHLLHEGWLARLGAEATAVLVLLALAADRDGASFFGRERMGRSLGLERSAVDRGLERLLALDLVAHRPWRPGHPDGIWQLLPVPRRSRRGAPPGPISLADTLKRLGFDG